MCVASVNTDASAIVSSHQHSRCMAIYADCRCTHFILYYGDHESIWWQSSNFFRDFRAKFAEQRRGWCVRMYKMQSHRHSVAICCVNWFGFVTAATAASWVMPFWSMQFGKFCNTQQWARIDSFTLWMLCDAMWVWLLAESWKNIPLYQHIQAGEYCVARIYLCFFVFSWRRIISNGS